MELKVLDNKGKEKSSVQFDESLLKGKGSPAVLHEAIVAFNANQRQGTHSVKTRGEVHGSGKKPYKQKGTGRARAGTVTSPLWRHGGIIFGPKPRDYSIQLSKKKKKTAFRMAFQSLFDEKIIQVVEPIELKEPKTKNVAAVYKKWNAVPNTLFIVDKIDAPLEQAARNIPTVRLVDADSLNTYDCLRARQVFITPTALEKVSARFGGGEKK